MEKYEDFCAEREVQVGLTRAKRVAYI